MSEVGDILEMWHFIESDYDSLSDADKAMVTQDTAPFGKRVAFAGFDAKVENSFRISLLWTGTSGRVSTATDYGMLEGLRL